MKKLFAAVLAASVLATAAQAQTWPAATRSGKFSYRSAPQITSATVPASASVDDTTANLDLLVSSANGTTGLTILMYLDNGLLVSSSTVTTSSTPQTIRLSAPLNFTWFKISSTAPITNTLVSATAIQSKQ